MKFFQSGLLIGILTIVLSAIPEIIFAQDELSSNIADEFTDQSLKNTAEVYFELRAALPTPECNCVTKAKQKESTCRSNDCITKPINPGDPDAGQYTKLDIVRSGPVATADNAYNNGIRELDSLSNVINEEIKNLKSKLVLGTITESGLKDYSLMKTILDELRSITTGIKPGD